MASNNKKRSADSNDGPTPQEHDNLLSRRPYKKMKPSSFDSKQNDKNDNDGIINTLKIMGFTEGLIKYVMDENPKITDTNILVQLCCCNQDYYNKQQQNANNNSNHNSNDDISPHNEKKAEYELLKLENERIKLENEKLKIKAAESNYIYKWEFQGDNDEWIPFDVPTSKQIDQLSHNQSIISLYNGENNKITKINDTTGNVQNLKTKSNCKIRRIKKNKDEIILQFEEEKTKLIKQMDETKYIYKWEREDDTKNEWISYDMKINEKVNKLDINESFIFTSSYNNQQYEIKRTDEEKAYQMNVKTKRKRTIRRTKICRKDDVVLETEEKKEKIYEWQWKNEHNEWISYDEKINNAIEELTVLTNKNEYIFTFRNTVYKIRRISEDKAVQINTKTKYERHVQCIREYDITDKKIMDKKIMDRIPKKKPMKKFKPIKKPIIYCDAMKKAMEIFTKCFGDIPSEFVDKKYNRCYCKECHKRAKEKLVHQFGKPPKKYVLPIGWTRIGLKIDDGKVKMNKIWDNWHVAFHGTDKEALKYIFQCGLQLLKSGDITINGQELSMKDGHIKKEFNRYNEYTKQNEKFNPNQIFVTPSIKYASNIAYSKIHNIDNIGNVQFVLQLRIRPNCYKIGQETIGSGINKIDHHYNNNELEWYTKENVGILIYGLLIKVN